MATGEKVGKRGEFPSRTVCVIRASEPSRSQECGHALGPAGKQSRETIRKEGNKPFLFVWVAHGPRDFDIFIACDVSEEYPAIGRPYWHRAGVADKIDLRLGPAVKTLDALLAVDSALNFIDADKANYDAYYERALRLLQPNGVICIDNVLWGGSIVDPSDNDASAAALRALNAKIGKDERVDAIILSLGDGLNVVLKR